MRIKSFRIENFRNIRLTDIRDQCQNAGVAFFFKQLGGVNKKRAGRELDGRTWDQMPVARRVES